MGKLSAFSAPEITQEFVEHTWVIQYRKVNRDGTPRCLSLARWECWTAYPAPRTKVKDPAKLRIVGAYVREMLEYFQDCEQDVEYRILLQRKVERDENIATTTPCIKRWRGLM